MRNVKIRFSQAVIPLCDSYTTTSTSIDLQRDEKEQTRSNLDAYSSTTLSAYQSSINRFLDLTSDIQIVNIGTSHIGGRPRAEYHILINGVSIPLGSDRVVDRASFTTTLSDGDKNTLAFAFFLALLDGDPYLSDKIVIIDDPITSLDRNRRFCTSQEIVNLANRCQQLVVMSHDPFFLFDISQNITSCKHLEIYRSTTASEIREWEISESVKSDLRKNYDCLREFADSGLGNSRLVATTIRIYLEGLLRIKYPDEFPDAEWLGDFIARIHACSPGDTLHHLQGSTVQELEQINNYSKRFHHDQNPNAGSEPINETELESYVNRTLDLQKVL
jgi:wobble nucleotide-excising tRNase